MLKSNICGYARCRSNKIMPTKMVGEWGRHAVQSPVVSCSTGFGGLRAFDEIRMVLELFIFPRMGLRRSCEVGAVTEQPSMVACHSDPKR